MSSLKEIFEFSRAEVFALSILLLMVLVGGGMLFYQNTTETLPPELFIQNLTAAENGQDSAALKPTGEDATAKVGAAESDSAHTATVFILDLNTAPAESLMMLPRIGQVISRRIVAYRAKIGGFDSVGQLVEVKGIGEKKLEAVRKYLRAEKK